MAEGKIFAITGFGGGLSVGLQADTAAEYQQLLTELRALAAQDLAVSRLFAVVLGTDASTEQAAVVNVQQSFPQAQPVSTVGQPLPQPGVPAQPVAQPGPAAPPPTIPYPGNCEHGQRVYVDKPARGKPWRRWECAIPWSKGVEGRCAAVNVES